MSPPSRCPTNLEDDRLTGYETHGDLAHGFFYAQRTADNSIAIAAGSAHRYASRIDNDGAVGESTITYLTGCSTPCCRRPAACRSRTLGGVLAVPAGWSAA